MYANSCGVEILRTMSRFKKGKKNFVVACLRPPHNVKLGKRLGKMPFTTSLAYHDFLRQMPIVT